jgi:hypothetical protein
VEGLIAWIEPHHRDGKDSRPAYPLKAITRWW